MGESGSEKSLGVFGDGRDGHDNVSVRAARTARSVSTRGPLQKLRALETVTQPEGKNPPFPGPSRKIIARGPTAKYRAPITPTYPPSYGPYRGTS